MPFLVGIDEAGYGPNLGPLVISASLWHVDESPVNCDLYGKLADTVSRSVPRKFIGNTLAIADSKKLYKPGGGLAALEYGVLASLFACGRRPENWRDLWQTLAGDLGAHCQRLPWYESYATEVPIDADQARLGSICKFFSDGLQTAGVRLCNLRSLTIFPAQFNEMIEQYGTKGEALTRLTLELLGNVLEGTSDEPTLIVCDKHGGRNKYATRLQEHFPYYLIEIYGESTAQSVYRWGPEDRRVEIRFQSKGESFLPAALSSMASKYLRELAMRAFNDFWRRYVPNLRATAGYPVDARRFKEEIDAAQKKLQIDDRILWRCK